MSFDRRLVVISKYKGYDREDITIDNTSGGVGFTASKLNTSPPPKRVYISVEDAQVRFTYDGTSPTSSLGHALNPFDQIYVEGTENLKNFKAIRTGSTSGKLVCSYER